MKIDTYSLKGQKVSPTELPKDMIALSNPQLLSQAIHVYREKMHVGLAKTKTRGELGRTTKKVYKQKGTGGARHGSKMAPIFVGGGIAHGPKAIRRGISLPKKMARKALQVALGVKANVNQVIFVSEIDKIKKTSDVAKFLKEIRSKKNERLTFVLADKNWVVSKALRNIENILVEQFSKVNAYKILLGGKIVLDDAIIEKKAPATKTSLVKKKAVKASKTKTKK